MLSITSIATFCNAQILGANTNMNIADICIDSRTIQDSSVSLFVAIISNRHNGHQYLQTAYQNGVRAFLVSENIDTHLFPDATFLLVNNTVAALQSIAEKIRTQYNIPVIGITGSNGKTVVKEWLKQLLCNDYKIVRSPKSYNSQIGVPLSVLPMNESHTLGIFEAGISEPNEMVLLEKIIQPTIGIFTNIGEAHNQGFINQKQKIQEKLLLFQHCAKLVFCKDNQLVNDCVVEFQQSLKSNTERPIELFTWSFNQVATLQIINTKKTEGRTIINAIFGNENLEIIIPFTDAASVENAINCWGVLLLLKIKNEQIIKRIAALQPIAMRMELRKGEHNCLIINDTYNSDFTSLNIALDLLDQQNHYPKKTLILSDMQQTGRAEIALYTELSTILKERKINCFIGVGVALTRYQHLFENRKDFETHFFENTDALIKQLHLLNFENEVILLKGARSYAFERINLLLEQKIHQTVMNINLSAMVNNLNSFRRRLKPEVKTMVMVKAFSYGMGGFEIAQVLQLANVDYLAVAYVDEGVSLRKEKIELPIMVMSPSTEAFDRMIVWKLEPEIFNIRSLKQFLVIAKNIGVYQYPIHIKLDTGMHRLGFEEYEIQELIRLIKDETCIRISSIFSHLAASDDSTHKEFTQQQAAIFQSLSATIIDAIGYRPILHLCNTAGIVQFPEYHFDMVRLGLGLYGIDSSNVLNNQLQQISILQTTIAQIKHIKAGESIGYNRRGKAEKDLTIATICIGYADGYPRALSNGEAYVLIGNKPAKLIGNIAMDMCMADISGIEGVQEGDEVIVFGDALPIQQLADWAKTIPYEIMTSISQRVKRVYINEA